MNNFTAEHRQFIRQLDELVAKAAAFDKLLELVDEFGPRGIYIDKWDGYHIYHKCEHIEQAETLPEAIDKAFNAIKK